MSKTDITTADPRLLLPAVVKLARLAGSRIMEIYNTRYDIWHKDDQSPVTAADLASHYTLVEGLQALTGELPILSEEADIPDFSQRQHWHSYWLLDPLDGTREFIKGNGEFAVCIALIREHAPVLGVIHAPATGVSYYAAAGSSNSAWRTAPDTQQPVQITTCRPAHRPPVIAVSRSRHNARRIELLDSMGEHKLVTLGSALKSCLVAEGSADLYPCLGPTSEWDTAAAQCILEQAGGQLTDLQMQPLRYNLSESLTNPPFIAYGDRGDEWAALLRD